MNMIRIGLEGASSSTGVSRHSSTSSRPLPLSIPHRQKGSLKVVKGEEALEVQGFSGMASMAARHLLVSTETPISNAFFVPRSISRLCLEMGDFPCSFICFDYSIKPFNDIILWAMKIIGNAGYKERLAGMNLLSDVITSLATISPRNQG
ncbi:hypothetical protein U1Q18_021579 [Sarracenia purpurea var. burkii]